MGGFVYQDEGTAGRKLAVGVEGQGVAGFEADAANVVSMKVQVSFIYRGGHNGHDR